MKIENCILVFAGTMVLLSAALAHWAGPRWLFLTVFVGLNMIQSAFTGFCPAAILLGKLGLCKESNP